MSTKSKREAPMPLATDKDGKYLFIKLRSSGISPLVAMVDGLRLSFFGKEQTAWLRVETALEWFEKELPRDPDNKNYKMAITAYRRVLEHFRDGKIEFH